MSNFLFKQGGGGGGGLNAWTSSTAYLVGTVVTSGVDIYVCIVAHTSGASIEADIALGKWKNDDTIGFQNRNLMIAGSSFESNSVQGWTATGCATVTNGLPVSVGSGGAAFSSSNGGRAKGANTTAPAVTSSSPIDGVYSLNLATSGAGTIGDGYISQSIPVPSGFQAKMLTCTFKYKSASGVPVMSGTSANTYACAIYDVTNNAWIGMAGNFNFVQSSGVGDFVGTFQTASNTAAIQIFVYSPVAPVGASSLLLDNFYVGQQATQKGPAMSDQSTQYIFTPTNFGTIANGEYFSLRHGDKLRVWGRFTPGTPAGSTASIDFPATIAIDSAKLSSQASGQEVGTFNWTATGGAINVYSNAGAIIFYDGSTTNKLFIANQTNSSAYVKALGNAIANGSQPISFFFEVPISGWSSNSVMSQDTDTRVVAMTVNKVNGSVTANTTIPTWTTVYVDTHSALNASTGVYTVPVSGNYAVSFNFATTTGTPRGAIFKNATSFVSGGAAAAGGIAAVIPCVAGDTISVQLNTSLTITGNVPDTVWSINRLSGPAVIAASETVACRYFASATSISGSLATVSWTTKDYDTHGSMSAGTYTVPVSGKYQINTALALSGTFALNTQVNLVIQKNGATVSELLDYAGGVITADHVSLSDTINCLTGDTLRVQVSSGATGPAIVSSNTKNFISIERVGI